MTTPDEQFLRELHNTITEGLKPATQRKIIKLLYLDEVFYIQLTAPLGSSKIEKARLLYKFSTDPHVATIKAGLERLVSHLNQTYDWDNLPERMRKNT